MKSAPSPDRLLDIADRFGTPTYVYLETRLREQARALQQRLKPVPHRLFYAMKANASPAVLRILREEGLGFEAVSIAEVLLARRLGMAPEDIFYSGNNITDDEMEAVHAEGVLMNIGELSRLDRFGRRFPGAEVSLRVNPALGDGHHPNVVTAGEQTKFGIPLAELPRALALVERHGLDLIGLHQHIGSGIGTARALRDAMQVLLDASRDAPSLRFLNFGGGLDVPYRPDARPFDLDAFSEHVLPLLHNEAERRKDIAFWFEPGRFFVAEAGVLLTRVNTIKTTAQKSFAGTDTGFNQLIRPVLYDAYHEVVNLSNPAGAARRYDVVGNICETGDRLARNRRLPELREGDVLAVLDAGAYGMSMASEYNLRPLPAEVLLTADGAARTIRRRLSPAELVDRLLAETNWAETGPKR